MNSLRVTKVCLFFAALLLAGCSTLTELRLDLADKVFGREPLNAPAKLEEIKPSRTVKLDWSSQLGKTQNYDFTPVLEAGYVYGANAEGDISKLDVENGHRVWISNVGEEISGGVGVGGGLVLVGTNRGNLIAYDVSGKLVWKSQLSSEILSAPRYADGLVVARSGDNRIYGLDAADGTRKWVYERKLPALSLRSSAGIVVDGGAVYAGFSGGKMAAIRADNGKLLWETTVAIPKGVTEIERIADITSLPVVAGPVVYAVAYQGRVAAVDRVNGKVLWNRQISSYTGMSFEDEKLYISHALGSIYSLDYATGRTFWRQGDLLNRRLTAPLPVNDMVAVGDLEGYVHLLDIDDGKFSSRIKVDSNAVMSIIPGNSPSQLIVATRDGGLYAISVNGSGLSNISPVKLREPTTQSQPEVEEAGVSEDAPKAVKNDEATDSDDAEDMPRSILFKKDSILLPDDEVDSGPGIKLPKSQ
ncbi:MAG: outer membrane protein assembly factor BamB [Methylophilaceae bacterium]